MSDKIFVDDLEIEAIIGVFDWEREVKQLIRISYEVEVYIKKAFKSDNIEDTFDYKNTSKKIIKFVEKSSFQLIEALAENGARDAIALPQSDFLFQSLVRFAAQKR